MYTRRSGLTTLLIICMGAGVVRAAEKPVAEAATVGTEARKQVAVYRINPHPPKLDGVLDDPVWDNANWISGFMQKQPDERFATTREISAQLKAVLARRPAADT